MTEPNFEIREARDGDGIPSLAVSGELDLRVSPVLHDRIWTMAESERHVKLDLSGLTFLDSTGISVLVIAVKNARKEGWQLEIAEAVQPAVQRTLENCGVAGVLWPPAPA